MKKFNFCFSIRESFSTKIYRLRESTACYNYSSNSAILSIAAYIVNHFPKLRPPMVSQETYDNIKFQESFTDCSQTYHPFDDVWSNYIIDLVTNNHAIYHNSTLFVQIPVKDLNGAQGLDKNFEEVQVNEYIEDPHQRCNFLFGLPSIAKANKKIGIVAYRPAATNILEPRINSAALFIGDLFNNDRWSVFKVGDNQIPSAEELSTYDCIILPGSLYSVCDNPPPYIKTIADNVLQAYHANKKLKLIGTCFGHQLLSKCFGAQVEKIGRVGGIERVEYSPEMVKQYPFLNGIANIPQLYLSEHHEDFVMSVPKGFKLLAHSKSCNFESFISNDGRIFTTQFHSEYLCQFTRRHQKRSAFYFGKNDLDKFYVPQSEDVERLNDQHAELMLEALRKFIDS